MNWTPISEKLPPNSIQKTVYFVTLSNGNRNWVVEAVYSSRWYDEDNPWMILGERSNFSPKDCGYDVLAWMPINWPEPYFAT